MKPFERTIMMEDPGNYPSFMHGQLLPNFKVICDQPGGMLFEQMPAWQRRKVPLEERKCLTIMCPTNDYEQLSKLVYTAKAKGLWRKEFRFCLTTETPDNTFSNPARERYVRMVETYASAQLSYGTEAPANCRQIYSPFGDSVSQECDAGDETENRGVVDMCGQDEPRKNHKLFSWR